MGNFKIKPMFGGASSGYAKSSPGQSNKAVGPNGDGTTVNPITGNIDQNPTENVASGNNATKINTQRQKPDITPEGTAAYEAKDEAGQKAQDAAWNKREDARIAAAKESNRLAEEKEAARLAEENKNNGEGQIVSKKAKGRSTVLSKSQNMSDNARVKKDANQKKRLEMKTHMEAYDAEIHGTDKNAYRKEGKKISKGKALKHRSDALDRKMAKEIYVGGQTPNSVVDTQEDMNASNTDATLINTAEINTANTEKEKGGVEADVDPWETYHNTKREKIDKKKFSETKVGKKVTGLFKKYEEKKKKRKESKTPFSAAVEDKSLLEKNNEGALKVKAKGKNVFSEYLKKKESE